MEEEKKKGGRIKEHPTKAHAAGTYRKNMEDSGRVPMHVYMFEEERENLNLICNAKKPRTPQAKVIAELVHFALKNKDLFPSLFPQSEKTQRKRKGVQD